MTPTQWLFKNLWDAPKDKLTWYAMLRQAEEMQQEVIEQAYFDGCQHEDNGFGENPNEYFIKTHVYEQTT